MKKKTKNKTETPGAIFIVGKLGVGKTRLSEFLKRGGYQGPIYTSNTRPGHETVQTAEAGVVVANVEDIILEIEAARPFNEIQKQESENPEFGYLKDQNDKETQA